MRKLFLLLMTIPSLLFCQPNFWSHHSLSFEVKKLFNNASEIFYVHNGTTLFKSSDYGTNWDAIYQGPTHIYKIYFNKNFLANDKIIIKGNSSSSDVMISINSGQDWNILNLPSGVVGLYADYAIDTEGDIYALWDTLYYSSNNGENWTEVNAPQIPSYPTWTSASYKHVLIDSLGSFYVSIEWAAYIPSYGYIFGDIIYRSEDGGENWIEILASYSPSYYGALGSIFIIREKDIFAYDLGLRVNYHYNDDFINGYRVYPFLITSAVINTEENLFIIDNFYGQSGDFYVSINDGETWYLENSGIENKIPNSIVSDSLEYLYCATEEGIFKSNFTSLRFITDSAVVFEDTKIADTTFKSVAIVNPYPFTLEIDSLVTYPNNFFITEIGNGSIDPLDSIDIIVAYSPTELGALTGDIFLYFNDISGKVRLFGNSSHPVLIFESVHNFGVIDVGQSKTDTIWVANHSLNDIIVDSMYLVNNVDFSVGELTFPQLLEQNDSLMITATFTPSTSFIVERDTLTIYSNAENSIAKISLYGIGRNPVGLEGNDNIIIDFALYQNFPNPFNPTTTIKYSVPVQSHVKLVIYNSLGEVMTTLVDQTKERGNYSVYFNGENLSSGIYFYRMQAGDYNQVRKLILLK